MTTVGKNLLLCALALSLCCWTEQFRVRLVLGWIPSPPPSPRHPARIPGTSSSRCSILTTTTTAPTSSTFGTSNVNSGHGRRHTSTVLHAKLPEGYQEYGERLIRQAGIRCGVRNDDDLTIEWKSDRIVVTVRGQVYVSTDQDDDDDEDDDDLEIEIDDMEMEEMDEEAEEEDGDDDDDDDGPDANVADAELEDLTLDEESTTDAPMMMMITRPVEGTDVTALARAINAALEDDGGIGSAIAELHDIEVTTPGASDELQGRVMFDAYRGFEVICQQQDLKTKKIKQVEGRLVERNDEFTILNIKGRTKKMKNSTVLSVKLPKAKKEKGVK